MKFVVLYPKFSYCYSIINQPNMAMVRKVVEKFSTCFSVHLPNERLFTLKDVLDKKMREVKPEEVQDTFRNYKVNKIINTADLERDVTEIETELYCHPSDLESKLKALEGRKGFLIKTEEARYYAVKIKGKPVPLYRVVEFKKEPVKVLGYDPAAPEGDQSTIAVGTVTDGKFEVMEPSKSVRPTRTVEQVIEAYKHGSPCVSDGTEDVKKAHDYPDGETGL